jgi:hypothetical protein
MMKKKLRKVPRYFAGGLERIFVVIEITICFAFIFGCDWLDVKTFWVVLLFKIYALNLLQIDTYKIYFKIIYFCLLRGKCRSSPRP